MPNKSICLTEREVRGILSGSTLLLRPLKPQPYLAMNGQHWLWDGTRQAAMWAVEVTEPKLLCPYGESGGELWVQ